MNIFKTRKVYVISNSLLEIFVALFTWRKTYMESLFLKASYDSHQSKLAWSLGIEKKVDGVQECLWVLSGFGKSKSRG